MREFPMGLLAARKKQEAELYASRLNWMEWLKPPIDLSLDQNKFDVLSWLESTAYFIEASAKAYLVLQYGTNSFPRTHNICEIMRHLEEKNGSLVEDLCLATDLMTGGSIRGDIESLSNLNNKVQYEVVNPSDYSDMMLPLRVFSLYLGDVLQEKLKSTGKDGNIMRHLAWDRRSPRKGHPQGLPLIDVYEASGAYLGIPWRTLDPLRNCQLDKGELIFRFPMNWIFGSPLSELTVLFSHDDAKRFYEGMESDPSEIIRFGKCKQISTDTRSISVRCEGIATYGSRDPSPIHFNLKEPEPSLTGHRIVDGENQFEAMAKLKSMDIYKGLDMPDLYLAIERDFDHVVQHLVRSGCDVNESNPGSWTPLGYAAVLGSCNAARILIGAGAEIDKGDGEGHSTPLLESIHGPVSNDPNFNTSMAILLIEHGADVLAKTDSGLTAIHLASFYDSQLDRLRLFLGKFEELGKLKDSVNAQDDLGRTALHIACDREVARGCVELLLDHGASKSIKNNLGQFPIDVANRPVDPGLLNLLSP